MTFTVSTRTLILVWYVHPVLRARPFVDALQPILLLHCFRYIGVMFPIPGVTSTPLDPPFAVPAAYGGLVVADLAFATFPLNRHVKGDRNENSSPNYPSVVLCTHTHLTGSNWFGDLSIRQTCVVQRVQDALLHSRILERKSEFKARQGQLRTSD